MYGLVSGQATVLLHGAGLEVLPLVLVRPLTRARARRLVGRPVRPSHPDGSAAATGGTGDEGRGGSGEEGLEEGTDDDAADRDDVAGDGDTDGEGDEGGDAPAWDPG